MRFVKTFLNRILRIAEVLFLVMLILCIYSATNIQTPRQQVECVIFITMFSLLILACIGTEILKIGYSKRCSSCKKWFALVKQGKEYIGSENISVSVSTLSEEYRSDGSKTGRYSVGQQYVPGVKKTYHINYICRQCGKSCYTTEYKKQANV